MKSRVAAYLRVSDESQVEGYSLEAQRGEITRWCKRRGHTLVAVYSEEGVSAHSERVDHRPELMRLLDDARTGAFDTVVVHTLDRWSRNVGVQRQALQRLGDAKVGFASVTEDIDFTTPSSKLMVTMIGGVAEFFSDQLGVHVRKGLAERARQGKANGDLPFGYRRCREDDGCPPEGHPGGVHVVEAEAVALRELFTRYAAGNWTQTDAARWLNLQGFRTRNKRDTGRGAGPQPFTTWSVRDILNNPFYCGLVRWNRSDTFPGLHQPVIDVDVFRAGQVTKQAHLGRRSTSSGAKRPYLLKGLLRCAVCAEMYWGEQGGRQQRTYYRGARRGQSCECRGRSLGTEALDARVGLLVYALTLPSDWLERAKDKIAASGPSVRARIEMLESKRRRTARTFSDGAISEAEYDQDLSMINEEIAELSATPVDDGNRAAALLENLDVLWRAANVSERSRILSALLEAIYVDLEGHIVAIAPRTAMVPVFAALATRPETGVSLEAESTRTVGWRRGRVELPVQSGSIGNLLQA